MKIIDGKEISNQIKQEIKNEVDTIISKGIRPPHLAAVIVGNDGASLTYVGSKVRSCEQIGIKSTLIHLEDIIFVHLITISNHILLIQILNQIIKPIW